jgi:hypothetical protein
MYAQGTSMETGLGKAVKDNISQSIPEVNTVLDAASDDDGLNITILAVWDADGNLIPELADGYEEPAPAPADPKSTLDEFEAGGGQPWQVTRSRWVEIMRGHMASLGQEGSDSDFSEFHRGAVKTALDAGDATQSPTRC